MRQGRTAVKTRVILSFFFLLHAAVLHSQTIYFVAKNGSNSNPGTEAQPFLTIAKGLSVLSPGKTLYIKAGTYNESLRNSVPAGTSWSNPVTVAAYPGNSVIVMPPSSESRVFNPAGSGTCYIILSGLILDAQNVGYDVIKFDQSGSDANNAAHHIRIQDCEVRNSPAQGILMTVGTKYNEIRRCRVHSNGTTDFHHGMYITSSYNLVDSCEVYQNKGWGIHVYNSGGGANAAHDNTVRNNSVHDNAASGARGVGIGIYTGANNMVYNNVVWNNAGGIAVEYGASNTQIYNNTFYNNNGRSNPGIKIGSDASTTTLRNNIIVQSGSAISNSGSGTIQDHNLTTDPGFVNAAEHDFCLMSSASAIDAGVAVGGFNVDCAGIQRPQGSGWDIGAFEHKSGTSTPTAPVLVKPADGATGRTVHPTLQWSAVPGASMYRLQVSKSTSFSSTVFDNSNITTTSQPLSGLAKGTTYYWRVNATASGTATPWSPTWSFKTKQAVIRLEPQTVDFGDVSPQETRSRAVVIWNKGDDTLWVSGVTTRSPIFIVSTRSIVLAPGDSFTDTITATGFSSTGPVSDVAVVESNAERGSDTIVLKMNAVVSSTEESKGRTPTAYALSQNYPNPFNPSTIIRFAVPEQAYVTLTVYNALGQRVTELVNGRMDAGYHEVQFLPSHSADLPSGRYFYRLVAGSFTETNSFLLLK